MTYEIKIEDFEGPLDLLLHLINENELDIYDIPIAKITVQYIDYLNQMKSLNLEITSEFILMASELLEIKSKMLLPNPIYETEEYMAVEEDPRDELVNKLLEYKKYKNAASIFEDRYSSYGKIYYKEQEDLSQFTKEVPVEELNKDLEEDLLLKAVKRVLNSIDKFDTHREDYFENVKRDLYTVEDKLLYIENIIKEQFKINFLDLINEISSKQEIIVTFLALLELLKINKIRVVQNALFDDIIIEEKGD